MIKFNHWYIWVGIAVVITGVYILRDKPFQVEEVQPPVISSRIGDATLLGTVPPRVRPSFEVSRDLRRPVPTNKWWSSGILENFPSPLYAWPIMSHITPEGVIVTAPGKTVTENAVIAAPKDTIRIFSPNYSFVKANPQDWGDWHVVFEVTGKQEEKLFDLTVAQGSPYIFFKTYTSELSVQLPPNSLTQAIDCHNPCGAALAVEAAETTYLLTVATGGSIIREGEYLKMLLPKADHLMSVAVIASDGEIADFLPYALQPVSGTKADFSVGDNTVTTTFTMNEPTLYGIFPHQAPYIAEVPDRAVGTYDTLRGEVRIYEGSSFKTVLSRPAILPSLPLMDKLRTQADFLEQVAQDVKDQQPPVGDVYASAKLLFKQAKLTELAHMIDDRDSQKKSLALLRQFFQDWCTAYPGKDDNFFAYDEQMGGLLAIEPAFGSEYYNDHHFHAGYFIHSAAILTRLDTTFKENYGDCVDLIIQDIAAVEDSELFPRLRSFDPYAGHSWANGIQALLDGNNQESTSEAIHAWFSIALWGKATDDENLENLGIWLMAQEIAATRAYWFNTADVLPETFEKPMISILWGGKVDYGTFFDADPMAIHGIQFFPISTALLPTVRADILSRLAEPVIRYSYDTIWDTNLVLVNSLGNNRDATRSIPDDAAIDASLSRSYMAHWMKTLTRLGTLEEVDSACAFVFVKDEVRTAVVYRYPQDPAMCLIEFESGREVNLQDLKEGWNIVSL